MIEPKYCSSLAAKKDAEQCVELEGLLFLLVVGVVGFFVCRLLLAISKFFEAKTKALRHDLAVNNYREDD